MIEEWEYVVLNGVPILHCYYLKISMLRKGKCLGVRGKHYFAIMILIVKLSKFRMLIFKFESIILN